MIHIKGHGVFGVSPIDIAEHDERSMIGNIRTIS